MKKGILKLKKVLIRLGIQATLVVTSIQGAGKIQDLLKLDSIVNYNEIVDDFSDLLKEIDTKSPIDIFDYYSYALWNGYLSNSKFFEYNTTRNLVLDYYGMECITGKAVCVNQADMLTDIFNSMGYKAFTINCYVDTDSEYKLDFIRANENTKRNINSEHNSLPDLINVIITPIAKLFGNHAITCVKYNDDYLFFDPTQLAYLDKNKSFKVGIINGKGEFELKYFSSIIYYLDTDIRSIFDINDESYSKEVLANPTIDIDEEALEKFYQEHKDEYSKIAKKSVYTNNFIIFVITLYLSNSIVNVLHNALKKGKKEYDEKSYLKNCDRLINNLNEFLEENNLTELYNMPINLYQMLEKGYLSSKKWLEQEINPNVSLARNGIENIVDNNHKALFMKYILSKYYETSIVRVINYPDTDIKMYILIFKINNKYYFYDFENKQFLVKKNQYSLISEKNEYIICEFDHEILQYVSDEQEIKELNLQLSLINDDEMQKFYNDNKKLIDSLAKKLVIR